MTPATRNKIIAQADDMERLQAIVDQASHTSDRRLPSEPRLCEILNVTRGRLRTLLKRLEDQGQIWRHVGKGTFVGPQKIAQTEDILLIEASVDAIFDARLILEPQLAAQAAIHATPLDIAAMDGCLRDMAHTENFVSWRRLDERLHRMIAEATHNIVLLMLYDRLRGLVQARLDHRMAETFSQMDGPQQDSDVSHSLCVDAIRSHNPTGAEQAMRNHIRNVRSHLFGLR